MLKRILLVNVGMDADVSSIANDGSFPALGVVALATMINIDHPDIEVMAIDGQVTPRDNIERLIFSFRPDLVGLSVLGSSYQNSLYLARVSKSTGAVTVFGNDHAAALGDRIIRLRKEVDFICTADIAEFAFSALIFALNQGNDLSTIPRLLYRDGDQIRYNNIPEVTYTQAELSSRFLLDKIPVPNRRLLAQENWNSYLTSYMSRYGRLHSGQTITGITTMNRARGCARAKNPCNFCGIADLTPRFSSPDMFWKDVRAGVEDVNASIFYEAFDSFSSAPRWVESVVRAKPKDLDPSFFVYTQAAETTPVLVGLYKELGVYRVNMGLEAGDTAMLKRLKGVRDSLERNQKACYLFKEAGIPIYGSLVLGGQGETHDSLQNTIDFGKWLIDNEMMAALEAQPIYPDFGALTGRWMMNPSEARAAAVRQDFRILDDEYLDRMPAKYGHTDEIDFDEISRDFNRIFCQVSWDDLVSATGEITSYAAKSNTVAGSARMSNSELQRGVAISQNNN